MDILIRIKRLIIAGNVLFTKKAELEMDRDDLNDELVCEAILNAPSVSKVLKSSHPQTGKHEHLYVIIGLTYDDIPVYTKGKFIRTNNEEKFYVLISSKKSIS